MVWAGDGTEPPGRGGSRSVTRDGEGGDGNDSRVRRFYPDGNGGFGWPANKHPTCGETQFQQDGTDPAWSDEDDAPSIVENAVTVCAFLDQRRARIAAPGCAPRALRWAKVAPTFRRRPQNRFRRQSNGAGRIGAAGEPRGAELDGLRNQAAPRDTDRRHTQALGDGGRGRSSRVGAAGGDGADTTGSTLRRGGRGRPKSTRDFPRQPLRSGRVFLRRATNRRRSAARRRCGRECPRCVARCARRRPDPRESRTRPRTRCGLGGTRSRRLRRKNHRWARRRRSRRQCRAAGGAFGRRANFRPAAAASTAVRDSHATGEWSARRRGTRTEAASFALRRCPGPRRPTRAPRAGGRRSCLCVSPAGETPVARCATSPFGRARRSPRPRGAATVLPPPFRPAGVGGLIADGEALGHGAGGAEPPAGLGEPAVQAGDPRGRDFVGEGGTGAGRVQRTICPISFTVERFVKV